MYTSKVLSVLATGALIVSAAALPQQQVAQTTVAKQAQQQTQVAGAASTTAAAKKQVVQQQTNAVQQVQQAQSTQANAVNGVISAIQGVIPGLGLSLPGLGSSTTTAAAAPKTTATTGGNSSAHATAAPSGGKPMVVYWGQSADDPALGDVCNTAGVSTVVLSFVTGYGGGKAITANFGAHCQIPGDCSAIETGMAACRASGKKVFISIGGWSNKGTLGSETEAKGFADGLWGMFGPPSAPVAGSPRAFGQQYVDGFDFDLEQSGDPSLPYYPAVISQLRSHFAGGSYTISGSPMCSLSDPNTIMAPMVKAAKFDVLLAQFYNAACGASGSAFNLDSFPSMLSGGASSGATVYVGLPASLDAGGSETSSQQYYLPTDKLTTFLNKWKGDSLFAGVMLWDAGHAATNVQNGCNYMQQVNSILSSGKAC